MSMANQLILMLSALGSINGLILALYLWQRDKQKIASRFLAGMFVMISIRTLKSVLFYFNPDIAKSVLQIGLSSCLLIGPLLYFFCRSHIGQLKSQSISWKLHLGSLLAIIFVVGIMFPYDEYRALWGGVFYRIINLIWLAYLMLSLVLVYPIAKKTLLTRDISRDDIWLLTAFTGNFIVWLAYFTASYTSYIVGAMSFTFLLLMGVLAFIFRSHRSKAPVKYANHKIEGDEAQVTIVKLHALITEHELYKDPLLTMPKVAKRMAMSTPRFSQLLNDNLEKSFSNFINEYRINFASELLKSGSHMKIEEIALCSGFNSVSTFYAVFKKYTGLTPAKFKTSNAQIIPNL